MSGPHKIDRDPHHKVRLGAESRWRILTVIVKLMSLIKHGHRNPIVESDLASARIGPNVSDAADRLYSAFHARANKAGNRLAWALWDAFRHDLVVTGLCELGENCSDVIAAFGLRFVLSTANGTTQAIPRAVGAVVAIVAIYTATAVLGTIRVYKTANLISDVQAALRILLQAKSTRVSARVHNSGHNDTGRVMALVNNDAERLSASLAMLHLAWVTPGVLLLVLALLCVNITYSALPAFFFLIAAMSASCYTTSKKSQALQRKVDVVVRQRTTLISTLLEGIRFAKLHVWEPMLAGRLEKLRKQESLLLVKHTICNTSNHAWMRGLFPMSSFLGLMVFHFTGHTLTSPITFSTLTMFSSLVYSLGRVPTSLVSIGQARLSAAQLQDYLAAEEADDVQIPLGPETAFKHASFTWEVDDGIRGDIVAPFKLADLNLTFRPGITVVVGVVGSGKTSLLAALSGEMRRTAGTVTVSGSLAYCPQTPWIRNATIRDNVVFGRAFNATRYRAVIDACALSEDIDTFPTADDTEIGERGVILSGGQKQRLVLARALYDDAPVLLLDDPLSAVDAPTGMHLFINAIQKMSKGKTVIMASHQLQVLSSADNVVWLAESKIRYHGIYSDLIKDSTFAEFIGTLSQLDDFDRKTDKHRADQPETSQHEIKAYAQIADEDRAYDHVHNRTIRNLVTADGSIFVLGGMIVTLLLCEGVAIFTTVLLAWWIDHRIAGWTTGKYVATIFASCVATGILSFSFGYSSIHGIARANYRLFVNALAGILRAPVSWYDGQPKGRILSRFTGDVMLLDRLGPINMKASMQDTLTLISIFVLTIIYYPWFALALIPLYAFLAFSTLYTQRTTRELRRIGTLQKNKAISLIQESVTGYQALRQYRSWDMFKQPVDAQLESLAVARQLEYGTQVWLLGCTNLVSLLLLLLTGLLVVFSDSVKISSAYKGVVLSAAVIIMPTARRWITYFGAIEETLHGCERLQYYVDGIPREAASETYVSLPESWPASGAVRLEGVSLKYQPDSRAVLQNLNLDIKSGEKIGLIGRTGAGKSSLLSALFRMVELSEGKIEIDGVDISTLGLAKLRSSLSIIPQDPLLFEDTIRNNLDPYQQFEDSDLEFYFDQSMNTRSGSNSCSEKIAEATKTPPSTPSVLTLDFHVKADGQNLSLGQRQQISLARALLQRKQVVILDEATSSVDVRLDGILQSRLRNLLKGKTVISIAHRLSTILGFDRVVVLSAGKIVQCAEPITLWDEADGIFRDMCVEAGIRREDITAAREAANQESDGDDNTDPRG